MRVLIGDFHVDIVPYNYILHRGDKLIGYFRDMTGVVRCIIDNLAVNDNSVKELGGYMLWFKKTHDEILFNIGDRL